MAKRWAIYHLPVAIYHCPCMSITSDTDWRGLRAAGRVVRLTLDALEQNLRAGVTTRDLDRIADQMLAQHGARSAPALVYGFPGSALISINDEVVHGVPGHGSFIRSKPSVCRADANREATCAQAAA